MRTLYAEETVKKVLSAHFLCCSCFYPHTFLAAAVWQKYYPHTFGIAALLRLEIFAHPHTLSRKETQGETRKKFIHLSAHKCVFFTCIIYLAMRNYSCRKRGVEDVHYSNQTKK